MHYEGPHAYGVKTTNISTHHIHFIYSDVVFSAKTSESGLEMTFRAELFYVDEHHPRLDICFLPGAAGIMSEVLRCCPCKLRREAPRDQAGPVVKAAATAEPTSLSHPARTTFVEPPWPSVCSLLQQPAHCLLQIAWAVYLMKAQEAKDEEKSR